MLYTAINRSNDLNVERGSIYHNYRFYVGRGNNFLLVRSVIKQRWWWSLYDQEDFEEVNFMWTQWRKNKLLAALPAKLPVTKQEMLDLQEEHRLQCEEARAYKELPAPFKELTKIDRTSQLDQKNKGK